MAGGRRISRWLSILALLTTGCQAALPAVPTATVGTTQSTVGSTVQTTVASPTPARSVDPNRLQTAFAAAAREFGVPETVLLAVSYNESRWEDHDGQPSTDGGYGPMHLTDVSDSAPAPDSTIGADATVDPTPDGSDPRTLIEAAQLIGVSPDALKSDPVQNVRGGAALLAKYARETVGSTPANDADWYGAVAKYRDSPQADVAKAFADDVFATIQKGVSRTTDSGQIVALHASGVTPNKATAIPLNLKSSPVTVTECGGGINCDVIPTASLDGLQIDQVHSPNINLANRPADGLTIRYIVIHNTEESYDSAVHTLQDPRTNASAHYLIRSSDGHITQLVDAKDVAHHAGNWYVNAHSIGIEHEGHAAQGATWFNEQLYQSSARLVRYLALKYDVPLDRAHIIGHDNVPGQTAAGQGKMHWDPGPYWDWAHYMELLGAPIAASGASKTNQIVTIDPNFHANALVVSDCSQRGCPNLPSQPSNFLYLRTAPSADAPLIEDASLQTMYRGQTQGTLRIDDWGDKASTGEEFYRVDTQGDWDAIYFGGQKAWFYNPGHASTVAGKGTLVKPKAGRGTIPVYGTAFPEVSAFPTGSSHASNSPLQYTIPAGQIYVATDLVTSDYFSPRGNASGPAGLKDLKGNSKYYQIFFNHRIAFVNAADVDVVASK